MKTYLFSVVIAMFLFSTFALAEGRYALALSASGVTYKIDTQTGRAWKLTVLGSQDSNVYLWVKIFEPDEVKTAIATLEATKKSETEKTQ